MIMPDKGVRLQKEIAMNHVAPYLPKGASGNKGPDLTEKLPKQGGSSSYGNKQFGKK